MAVDELVAQVRQALSSLPTAALQQAAELLAEGHQTLAQVAIGSSSEELQSAAAGLANPLPAVTSVAELVGRAKGLLEEYVNGLGVSTEPVAATGTPRPEAKSAERPAAPPPKPDGQRLTRDQAVKLQEDLPPPVVSMSGQKTHGRWIDEHGEAHEIVSGQDEDAAEAARLLREKGIPQRGDVTTTADVEQKIAARMVREGRKHVDVVLNNRPCRGVYGCDALLPVILPPGYTLTVHAPNYQKTFTGGQ
jgi:hypothetical protein